MWPVAYVFPDFRCVWLKPSPRQRQAWLAPYFLTAVVIGFSGIGTTAHFTHAALVAVILVVGFLGLVVRPLLGKKTDAVMVVVPWGVIVDPDVEPRVFRWAGIDEVRVAERHRKDEGTPVVIETHVTIKTRGRGSWTGISPGAAGLDDLTVNLGAYAEDAARTIALDFERVDDAVDGTEPAVARLLEAARDLVSSSRGAAELALPARRLPLSRDRLGHEGDTGHPPRRAARRRRI